MPKGNIGIFNGYQLYFKKYSHQYHLMTWDGDFTTLQQALSLDKKPIDLLLLNKKTADQACDQGLLIPTSDDLLSSENKQCNFQNFMDYIGIAWDSRKIHFQPSWQDFWNITQYPGKRGLQKDAFSALSIALLADGVAAKNITEVLSTPSGILRAFKKLNQLRPYIVWWTTPNDANFLLHQNQVLMTSASILSISAFQKSHPSSHFQFQYQDTIENPIVLSIPMTIQTQQIKKIQRLLQKNPKILFSQTISRYQQWKAKIKQELVSSQQPSISLDDIFDEWLTLTKSQAN